MLIKLVLIAELTNAANIVLHGGVQLWDGGSWIFTARDLAMISWGTVFLESLAAVAVLIGVSLVLLGAPPHRWIAWAIATTILCGILSNILSTVSAWQFYRSHSTRFIAWLGAMASWPVFSLLVIWMLIELNAGRLPQRAADNH